MVRPGARRAATVPGLELHAQEGLTKGAGLTTLATDEYGSGPTLPMLPGSWDQQNEVNDPQ
jgi:hypothetical protein